MLVTPWKPLAVAVMALAMMGQAPGARRAGSRPAGLQRREVRRGDCRRDRGAARAGAGQRGGGRARSRAISNAIGRVRRRRISNTRGPRCGWSVPDQLAPRDHVDFLVGLGLSLYLDGCDGCFSAAAEMFDRRAGARRTRRRSRARVRMVGQLRSIARRSSDRRPSAASSIAGCWIAPRRNWRATIDRRRRATGWWRPRAAPAISSAPGAPRSRAGSARAASARAATRSARTSIAS